MNIVCEKERDIVLCKLNEDPEYFLRGICKKIMIGDRNFTIALDRIRGGVVVWGKEDVHKFKWSAETKKWA